MSNIINLGDLIDEAGIIDEVRELALANIIVTPKTINIYSTTDSEYSYTEDELLYSKDHLLQLVNDIVLSNLDKIDYKFERVYDFKVGEVYWLVNSYSLPIEVIISELNCRIDSRDSIVVEEIVRYTSEVNGDTRKGAFFNYNCGYDQRKEFFKTRQEAVTFFKDKFDLN